MGPVLVSAVFWLFGQDVCYVAGAVGLVLPVVQYWRRLAEEPQCLGVQKKSKAWIVIYVVYNVVKAYYLIDRLQHTSYLY